MKQGNLAVIPFERNLPTDKDGEDGDGPETFQVTIDVVENGFIVSKNDSDELSQRVFLFNGTGETGPKAMIEELIEILGIPDKVKIVK